MNKSALLFAVGAVLVLGLPPVASAYDDDPGYGTGRPWYGGGSGDMSWRPEGGGMRNMRNEPIYYRPTMRYYGKGYTVSYRYVPVFLFEAGYGNQNASANFRTEAFRIPTSDIAAWGAKAPRLVVANKKTPTQSGVTTIQRRPVNYSAPAPLPVPSAPLPTPNLDPTPVPSAPQP